MLRGMDGIHQLSHPQFGRAGQGDGAKLRAAVRGLFGWARLAQPAVSI